MISPYEQKEIKKNIKFVRLGKVASAVDVVSPYQKRNFSFYEKITYEVDAARDKTDFALSDDNFLPFLKSDEKFDLLILDVFLNDALLG